MDYDGLNWVFPERLFSVHRFTLMDWAKSACFHGNGKEELRELHLFLYWHIHFGEEWCKPENRSIVVRVPND